MVMADENTPKDFDKNKDGKIDTGPNFAKKNYVENLDINNKKERGPVKTKTVRLKKLR